MPLRSARCTAEAGYERATVAPSLSPTLSLPLSLAITTLAAAHDAGPIAPCP